MLTQRCLHFVVRCGGHESGGARRRTRPQLSPRYFSGLPPGTSGIAGADERMRREEGLGRVEMSKKIIWRRQRQRRQDMRPRAPAGALPVHWSHVAAAHPSNHNTHLVGSAHGVATYRHVRSTATPSTAMPLGTMHTAPVEQHAALCSTPCSNAALACTHPYAQPIALHLIACESMSAR